MRRNRGKSTRDKRDLIAKPPSAEERAALLEALVDPPRATSQAILGALVVENELEQSIRTRLRRVTEDEWLAILMDSEGPLGTFDRKVKVARLLGILDREMKANLDTIRTIRNKFAHAKRILAFDHPVIGSELAKITLPRGSKTEFSAFSKINEP